MSANTYEEYAADVVKMVNERVMDAIDNFDETFKGTPFGLSQLGDEDFVTWFDGKIAENPNWLPALALEDTGEGTAAIKRYQRLRAKGVPSRYAAPESVAQAQPVVF